MRVRVRSEPVALALQLFVGTWLSENRLYINSGGRGRFSSFAPAKSANDATNGFMNVRKGSASVWKNTAPRAPFSRMITTANFAVRNDARSIRVHSTAPLRY